MGAGRASRRHLLRSVLGAAAAVTGTAALLDARRGVTLATSEVGPTTFTSATKTPAVRANNTSSGPAVKATSADGYGALLAGGQAPLYLQPAATPGAPATGSHQVGELVVDRGGTAYVCTGSGSPGLWAALSDGLFNVKAFGAQGDGSTDDTKAIQSAIDAAQTSNGGIVYLPQGTYLVSGNLSVTAGNVTLAGAGQQATTITVSTSYATGDVITYSNLFNGGMRMLKISAPAQRQGGAAIHLDNVNRVCVQDVDMENMYIGCLIDGIGGVQQRIDRGDWRNFSPGGIGIWINIANANGNDQYISNIVMDNDPNNQPQAGVRIQNSQSVWMHACDIIHAGNGLLIDPQDNGLITWCFFSDCAWDLCSAHSMLINPASGAIVKGLSFVNCWSSSATYDGCYIGGPTQGIQFAGHRFYNNQANGLYVTAPAQQVYVDACSASGNNGGQGSQNQGMAFIGCNDFAVRNCRVGAISGYPVSQKYGILVDGGCNNYVITGNITLGNETSGIYDAGGPNKVVADNL